MHRERSSCRMGKRSSRSYSGNRKTRGKDDTSALEFSLGSWWNFQLPGTGDQCFESRISVKRFQVGVLVNDANVVKGNHAAVHGVSNQRHGFVAIAVHRRNAAQIVGALDCFSVPGTKDSIIDIQYLAKQFFGFGVAALALEKYGEVCFRMQCIWMF